MVAEVKGGEVVGLERGERPEGGWAEDGVERVEVQVRVETGADGGGVVEGLEVGRAGEEGAAGGGAMVVEEEVVSRLVPSARTTVRVRTRRR